MNDVKKELIEQHDFALSMANTHADRYRKEGIIIDWENYRYWDGRREGIRIALDLLQTKER